MSKPQFRLYKKRVDLEEFAKMYPKEERMVLCKDCKHIIWRVEGEPQCARSMYTEMITGKVVNYYCSIARQSGISDSCGPTGKHFEALEEGNG